MCFKVLLTLNLLAVAAISGYALSGVAYAQRTGPSGSNPAVAMNVLPGPAMLGKPQSIRTGSALDFRIEGHGFFQVDLPDGRTGYTRDGAFHLSSDGVIVNKDGLPMTPGVSVPGDAVSIVVGTDGVVKILAQNVAKPVTVGQFQLARFMNLDGLESSHLEGVYLETEDSGPPMIGTPGLDGFGHIEQGFLDRAGDEWMNELFQLLADSELDVSGANTIDNGSGVKQLLIVVNLR